MARKAGKGKGGKGKAAAPAKPVPPIEQWPAGAVERRPIAEVKPHPGNARTHPEKQLVQLDASWREYGQTRPVLVDEAGVLIVGHGTRLAAIRAGVTELFVTVARGWPEEKARAYRLADNQLALNSAWDDALLGIELADLSKLPTVDVTALGFSDAELKRVMPAAPRREGLTDEDAEAPEPPAVPASRPGDVWLLGKHRLVCGDCTDRAAVAAALAGAKPHLMVTDPPYGVDYDPDWRNHAARFSEGMGNRGIGAGAVGRVQNDHRADWRAAWSLFGGDVAYVWHAGRFASTVQASLEAVGFAIRAQVIWAKNNIVIGRGDYHWRHEPCWYAVREDATGHWQGARDQNTVWEIDKPQKSETGHGTQKPVECMRRPIENNSEVGDAVYEPFSGSGTTIIAAETTGRVCHAIEIDPAYVDVAVERWQTFTGEAATLEATGEPFAAVAAERRRAVAAAA